MTSNPAESPRVRLKAVFPGGFDAKFGQCSGISQHPSISRNGYHFSCKPEQLYDSLLERNDPQTPMESIIVKTAWYGKQTKATNHEFIAIQVEDINISGLINYLILDRNADIDQGRSKRASLVSSQETDANDAFKISYDGNIEKLIEECKLTPYKFLEELLFRADQPLRLYELAILAHNVSIQYPKYQVIDSSCYLFAGVIWECMRLMRPLAAYTDALAFERGKCHWFRYVPSASVILAAFREIQVQIPMVEKDLRGCDTSSNLGTLDKVDEEHDFVYVDSPPGETSPPLPLGVVGVRQVGVRFSTIQTLARLFVRSRHL